MMMGSVGSDELLVARQADDGGAGELLRRDRAAGGRRGVGQVPRRHGLEEPLGRRRACGRAGRRRWRPAGSSRHAQSAARTRRQDAEAGEHLKAARGRAKSKRTPQANRAARRRRRRGAASAARPSSCAGGSRSRLDGVMKKDAAARQRGKRKRDGPSQRRVRRQEARQDRDDHDAQRDLQRARSI